MLVTGDTAENLDYFAIIGRWLPLVFVFVLGLSFVLLVLAFRTIVVPAVAIVLNLLSVGAAYGLLVLVFQHGYGADLLGLQQVDAVEAWVPLFLFSVLFGLSMDYQVFLLSRIHERYGQTGTPRAVVVGVGSTARIITGAALIIVAVFCGFAAGGAGDVPADGLGRGRGAAAGRHRRPLGADASHPGHSRRSCLVPATVAGLAATTDRRGTSRQSSQGGLRAVIGTRKEASVSSS